MEGEDKEPDDEKKSQSEVSGSQTKTSSKISKISKNSSKVSVMEANETSMSTMKSSLLSPKYESKPVVKEDSLIPAFSKINDMKMVYQSKEEVANPVLSSEDHSTQDRGGAGVSGFGSFGNFPCSAIFAKRSPFIHNPPKPEEPRARIDHPRSPKDYIINLREDLADFQEARGLPRTRDYSFLSLGLALAQETARTICSLFLMFAELFPILAVISLILRFALDKIIEILETPETVPRVKKTIVFSLQMLVILIPLWILIGTIVIPFLTLILSIFQRMFRIRGGKKRAVAKPKSKPKVNHCSFF